MKDGVIRSDIVHERSEGMAVTPGIHQFKGDLSTLQRKMPFCFESRELCEGIMIHVLSLLESVLRVSEVALSCHPNSTATDYTCKQQLLIRIIHKMVVIILHITRF